MKKILMMLCSILLITSCNNKKGGKNREETIVAEQQSALQEIGQVAQSWKFDSLNISRRVYLDNDTTKDGMLINLNFIYPISVPDSLNLEEIQNTFSRIFLWMKNFSGRPEDAFRKKTDECMERAYEHAKYWKESGPHQFTSFSSFEETELSKIETETKYLLTLSQYGYSFEGGAHGRFSYHYRCIDKRDGTLITEDLLYKEGHENKLDALIQQSVKTKNESSEEDEHIDLIVNQDDIRSNQNFFFSEEGVVYVYNIYEIAVYAQGTVEVVIPYEQALPLINEKYLPIIESSQKNPFGRNNDDSASVVSESLSDVMRIKDYKGYYHYDR